MHIQDKRLKSLDSIQLTTEETTILKWLRSAAWEAVKDAKEPVPYKAKVPEFYNGIRLYRMQVGGSSAGSLGALEIFIKKLGFGGIITKPDLYPVVGHSNQPRYLMLKKADLDNLGVGMETEEE